MAITKVDPLTRIEKGSALSYLEMDTNFTGAATAINATIDLVEDTVVPDIEDLDSRVDGLDTRLTEAETRIEELPAEVDAAGTAATLITAHNTNIESHPDLVNGFEELSVAVDAITADPANAVTGIWVPAQVFENMQGSPLLSKAQSRIPVWLFPDGVNSYISTTMRLPSHWSTMSASFVMTNTTANAGSVLMAAEVHNWAIGDSINVSPSGSNRYEPVPTTAWVSFSMQTTGNITVDPTKTQTLRISRLGQSVNDTLLNDVAFIGVELAKVT